MQYGWVIFCLCRGMDPKGDNEVVGWLVLYDDSLLSKDFWMASVL